MQIAPGVHSWYTYRCHEDSSLWSWGLQRHFLRVSLQALRFAHSSGSACGRCLSSRQRQQKKRRHTTPPLPWAMADYAFSRQRKIVYKYQRPSVMNSLLRAESDIKLSLLGLVPHPTPCLQTLSIFFFVTFTRLAGHPPPLKVWLRCLEVRGWQLSNAPMAHALDVDRRDVSQRTTPWPQGIEKKSTGPLAHEVACDAPSVMAGQQGQPEVGQPKGPPGRRHRLTGQGGRGTLAHERPSVYGRVQQGGPPGCLGIRPEACAPWPRRGHPRCRGRWLVCSP